MLSFKEYLDEASADGPSDGWIAIYKGKKLEITKDKANSLWAAKQYAAKELKVPKSGMGLLAIKPAYNEEYLDEAQTSWRIEVPGEGVATVKGANETQAIDRALSKLNISKEVRDVWKNGKKRKELKISKE